MIKHIKIFNHKGYFSEKLARVQFHLKILCQKACKLLFKCKNWWRHDSVGRVLG